MKSLRLLDRRAGYSLASLGLLLGVVAPTLVPAFASAGQIDQRSITLSSSGVSTVGPPATNDNVSYELKFTPETAITAGGGLYVDFCNDSPIIGIACGTSPNDVDSTNATRGAVLYNDAAPASNGTITAGAHYIEWVAGSNAPAGQTVDITFNGLKNPAVAGTYYARVYTYANTGNLPSTTTHETSLGTGLGTTADTGAVALSFANSIGVTAYVQESMTFCVSGAAPSGNCGTANDPGNGNNPDIVTDPSVKLGVDQGNGQLALEAGTLSTANVYAQLSTNAANGATVRLQSDANGCGGLYLNGDTSKCNIGPQDVAANTIAAGQNLFGVEVAAASTNAPGASSPTGSLVKATGSSYSDNKYFMNYVTGDASGVTSAYGDPILDTAGAPVNNQNQTLTLGASINNNTPAGKYGATLRLIATGTF